MDIKIMEITDDSLKSSYTEKILRRLPQWFGNEQVNRGHNESVAKLPYWIAADNDGNAVGFMSAKIHYGQTGEIPVCGIVPEYHRKGIGTMLFAAAETYFRQNGCKYIVVKTLSDIDQYEPYDRTRQFYTGMGFEALITLTEMWDEENPCLIMIKALN